MKALLVFLLILVTTVVISCFKSSDDAQNSDPGLSEHLSLEIIEQYYENLYNQIISHIINEAGTNPVSVYEYEKNQEKDKDRYRLFLKGMNTVQASYFLYKKTNDDMLKKLAIGYADFLIEKFSHPEGHFIEYEKAPWLEDKNLWYTIPWGTAFSGMEMTETYLMLKKHFDEEQKVRWRKHLENTARWIYKNPALGSYVFNCTMDLCHVLWKIGEELDNHDWKSWALKSAHELIIREVDKEGWIHGENGVSPAYQLLGSDFVSEFAWESRDSLLIQTTHKLSKLIIDYSTSNLFWNGTFGTRSNEMGIIGSGLHGEDCMLVSAAFGNSEAVYLVNKYGKPDWCEDVDIWENFLANKEEPPVYNSYQEFKGITSSFIRANKWQAWFNNYDESLWARGFTGLWHESLGQAIFSTLHSLPTQIESAKLKLKLDDVRDWSGFPHVISTKNGIDYHSQQSILLIEADSIGNVKWLEPILSESGLQGGNMNSKFHFGDTIEMKIILSDMIGTTKADFHLLRKQNQYMTIWTESSIQAMVNGKLPEHNHNYNNRKYSLEVDKNQRIGFQINNQVFCFQIDELPENSKIFVGLMQYDGLHTENYGGSRLRIEFPPDLKQIELKLRFYPVIIKEYINSAKVEMIN